MNKRFDGFRNTPFLWSTLLEGLMMYTSEKGSIANYPNIHSTTHIRLGKLVEQFVLFEMKQDRENLRIKSNVQIRRGQITIGELDCLIERLDKNIHLEIVYKFYLYDPSISSELNRWVGPNRKDSLIQKLNKLKEKQFPLLYDPETTKALKEINMEALAFKQRVYFKAQLFLPFHLKGSSFHLLNNNCIKGFYIRYSDLSRFDNHTFYVPPKLDWLIDAHLDVEWLSIQSFRHIILEFLGAHKSPLCWMKSRKGRIEKFFVVWWE